MANTTYATVYGFIRTVLGDNGTIVKQYSDEALESQINWFCLLNNSTMIQGDGAGNFTTILSPLDQCRVTLQCALNILAPQDNEFRYSTPIISVSRKGGVQQLWSHIRQQLDAIEGGIFPMAVDTDIRAMLNGIQRWYTDVADAINRG